MGAFTALLKNHLILEYRSWTQGLGILVLVWIISYLVFRLNPSLSSEDINLLFWLFIMLFSVNAVMRQENHTTPEEKLMLYTLTDPVTIICSRIAYNFAYIWVLSVLFYLFLMVYFPISMQFGLVSLGVLALGALAISSCLTLVTAIGSQGGGQNTLVSILGFPLLIPVLILLNNISNAMTVSGTVPGTTYLLIIGISLAGIAMSIVLFPFIWKQ